MLRKSFFGYFLIVIVAYCLSCRESEEKKYKRFERQELAKNIRYDSLFLGLYFRMSHQDFRDYCFDMNLKGRFKQGGMKNSFWVACPLDELDYPAVINFYPKFEEGLIAQMDASIYYENARFPDGRFETDSLMLDVLSLMEDWYGSGYFKIKSPFYYKDDVYVKLNGNRRITIYPDQSGQMINLWYVDLKPQSDQNE